MPHTAVLPLNYTHLKPREKFEFSFLIHEIIVLPLNYLGYIIYLGAIRTLINKYQKFRTYLLVNEIFTDNKIRTYTLLILSETCLPIAAYLFKKDYPPLKNSKVKKKFITHTKMIIHTNHFLFRIKKKK